MAPAGGEGKVLSAIPAARWVCAAGCGARRKTGKLVWKAYTTGPDKDVLIGAGFPPVLSSTITARISA